MVDLKHMYVYRGQTYGPGETDVPDDVKNADDLSAPFKKALGGEEGDLGMAPTTGRNFAYDGDSTEPPDSNMMGYQTVREPAPDPPPPTEGYVNPNVAEEREAEGHVPHGETPPEEESSTAAEDNNAMAVTEPEDEPGNTAVSEPAPEPESQPEAKPARRGRSKAPDQEK